MKGLLGTSEELYFFISQGRPVVVSLTLKLFRKATLKQRPLAFPEQNESNILAHEATLADKGLA